ncbi:DUF115 domain-containing protein, partial [Candidatus Micrarchaeota archaeon]|nr:DUF115 domain-containing protein [Candidatus Micrarchaeota archaeon]
INEISNDVDIVFSVHPRTRKTLLENKIIPKINVTDLDGDFDSILQANKLGSITVVHAHGDNIAKIKRILPLLKGKVVCTTQIKPLGRVHNFYGFTDGDRAVSLSIYFKAKPIFLYAFKFYDDTSIKARKLQVGKYLIEKYAKTYRHLYDLSVNESNLGLQKISIPELEKLLKNG